ncbi:hypothetical protein MASR2M29_17050 [Spirochaetota bacterium]
MKNGFFAAMLLIFVSAFTVHAQSPGGPGASTAAIKAFPDFLPVRGEFLPTAITVVPAKALSFEPQIKNSPAGRIQISVERDGDYFYVLFLRERDGEFPLASRGNMIFKRDVAKGYVSRLVWFLSDDGLSYVSLTPRNERTVIDYVVGGAVIRSSYMISALIYQLFTSPFTLLQSYTAAALDWSMVLGNSSSPVNLEAMAFAESLEMPRLSTVAMAFFNAGTNFSDAWKYLELSGNSSFQPLEVTDVKYRQLARFRDRRDPDIVAAKPWTEQAGLPVEALIPLVLDGIDKGQIFIAMLEGNAKTGPRKLAIVPYRAEDGSYKIAAFDAYSRKKVDMASLLEVLAGSYARLFMLPLPKS